jgi:hypothetical protein
VVTNGTAELVWQTPSGSWVSLEADGLDSESMQATLEHVADTAGVGDLDLALPIRISGVPVSAKLQTGQITQTTPTSAGDGVQYRLDVALAFGVGGSAAQAAIAVVPAGEWPVAPSGWSGACKVQNGYRVCVYAPDQKVDHYLSGGLGTLLDDVTSLGTDPAHWSPDLVTGTK